MPPRCDSCGHERRTHAVIVRGQIMRLCEECKREYEARKEREAKQ